MSLKEPFGQPLLTFPDAEKSPLSIRAKALVFIDPRARRLREEMEQLAPRELPVLIRGESGTGKELLARHIHRGSDRPGLFVSVNCGAISPTYADAELFGYAAGAHSGSVSSRAGWFGSANGGTLYLDEIGDLPLPIQIKLLAALENHEVTRVGAQQPSPVDVRLVAATSIDLAQAVAAGKFHERLFHYLSEGHLELPALREQPGNILPLAEYFLGIYSQRLNLAVPLISDAAQAALEAHTWPGNTRELENVIHFALLVSSGEEILPEHLNLPVSVDPLLEIERLVGKVLVRAKVDELFALQRALETMTAKLEKAIH
ncbi:sigma-54 factor, interaction region [Paucimonas lemoignei]|jgi:transcriptional regulator with AAA-type ATPase domain|nr:sigma-54 factor, interaction region [Paucimonas lemoignei]